MTARLSWRRWSLRTRMVVAVVGLAALALLVTNFAAATTLRQYLVQQLDGDVRQLSGAGGFGGGPGPRWAEIDQGAEPEGLPPGNGHSIAYVYTPDGQQLRSPRTFDITPEQGPQLGTFEQVKARPDGKVFTAASAAGEDFRVAVNTMPDGLVIVGAISLDRVQATTNLLLFGGLGISAVVLVLLGFAAHTLVRIGLRPLTQMEQAAAHIAAGDLTARVPDPDPHTEPGRLGLALNTMLSRIEAAVSARAASEQRLRQFLADASHELRTPLTSIRGFAELYRHGGTPPGPQLDETMSRIEQEAARMGLLVEDLLLLAALDEQRPLHHGMVDLLALAADTVRDAHVRSPRRHVELAGFEPVTVAGDEHRLRQVAMNLVANALQHTPADTRITLRITHRGAADDAPRFELPANPSFLPTVAAVGAALPEGTPLAVIEVIDDGPGVPLEHAGRIFERLYRADPHRARTHGGAGLGLAIAAAIVQAHGGRIELATAPGAGAIFRVLLPQSL